jgi:hypothetical protein
MLDLEFYILRLFFVTDMINLRKLLKIYSEIDAVCMLRLHFLEWFVNIRESAFFVPTVFIDFGRSVFGNIVCNDSFSFKRIAFINVSAFFY